ncbi:unnamed protein product [Caenorhabditis angaria]|uniref:Calponin-homology (CH) domain-containing protein n=1 Tax=Caenorhabditis angaria TaxID=860376 RepID=A0A9P1I9F9_9PELO|nr:unnamed protein product [Caenorhabditis angaria]
MSAENQQAAETVAAVVEEVVAAPELPKSDPPAENVAPAAENAEAAPVAAEPAAEGEAAAPAEETKEKKSGGIARRFTFNKRWGKHRDEAAAPKEPEAPKDPKEDVLGWIAQQIPQAVHKANYQVLDWIQNTAVENEADRKAIPGKDQSTTRNQFLGFLRDGDLLVKLANTLQAGAIEPAVAEENADAAAQKEVQKKNIESFATWAGQTLGAENVLKAEDLLEKGKAGYSAVFSTLWQLGVQAKEKFEKDGFDVETIVNIASQVVKSGLLTTILGFFRRNRQPVTEEAKEGENAAAPAEGEAAKDGEAAAEPAAESVEEPVAVKVETSAPAAVAAN